MSVTAVKSSLSHFKNKKKKKKKNMSIPNLIKIGAAVKQQAELLTKLESPTKDIPTQS